MWYRTNAGYVNNLSQGERKYETHAFYVLMQFMRGVGHSIAEPRSGSDRVNVRHGRFGFAAGVGFAAVAVPRRTQAFHLWAMRLVRPLAQ